MESNYIIVRFMPIQCECEIKLSDFKNRNFMDKEIDDLIEEIKRKQFDADGNPIKIKRIYSKDRYGFMARKIYER